ncbi:VOC family protein [Nocardioides convexus]|uniref:VOC family protein n=1 Tax=Nocardioides convexus TaxID=2712224 RepID=UPI00241844C8|nr:VOC family protein [Nocardioides convexus]
MTALHRVIVSVASTEAALGFYGDLLGLAVARQGPMTRLGDGPVESAPARAAERAERPRRRAEPPGPGRRRDVRGVGGRRRDRGGPPGRPAVGERQAVVRDPDGHLVCLVGERG